MKSARPAAVPAAVLSRALVFSNSSIPLDVAQSMAFEREPVPVETIRAMLARIEPPIHELSC